MQKYLITNTNTIIATEEFLKEIFIYEGIINKDENITTNFNFTEITSGVFEIKLDKLIGNEKILLKYIETNELTLDFIITEVNKQNTNNLPVKLVIEDSNGLSSFKLNKNNMSIFERSDDMELVVHLSTYSEVKSEFTLNNAIKLMINRYGVSNYLDLDTYTALAEEYGITIN